MSKIFSVYLALVFKARQRELRLPFLIDQNYCMIINRKHPAKLFGATPFST
jgi:hypothetical protein